MDITIKYRLAVFTLTAIFLSLNWSAGFAKPGDGNTNKEVRTNQTIIISEVVESLIKRGFHDNIHQNASLRLENASASAYAQTLHLLTSNGFSVTDTFADYNILVIEIFPSNSLHQNNKTTYSREISAEVAVRLSNSGNEIIQSDYFSISYTDSVPLEYRDKLESDWYASKFDRVTERDFKSRFRKIAEPVIVTAALGTTVYLLYNIRSR